MRCLVFDCYYYYCRVSEGVEHYLDLLVSLHTDQQNLQVSCYDVQ